MFYKKNIKSNNLEYVQLNLSTFSNGVNTNVDENLLPYKYAKLAYNYKMEDGALKTGYGFEVAKFPKSKDNPNELISMTFGNVSDIKKVWLFRYYSDYYKTIRPRIMYYTVNGLVNYNILYTETAIYNAIFDRVNGGSLKYFTSEPNAIYYRLNSNDVCIFTSPTDNMYIHNPEYSDSEFEDAPKFTSMCIHYERLFATVSGKESKTLWFSDDFDPTNWNISLTEAGTIEMADDLGPLNKVLSFKDYVYVFRDFGISKVSAYGNQEDFSVYQIYSPSGKIYENTVTICGDQIIFLAKHGLYSFNGYNITKIDTNINEYIKGISNENAKGCFYGGKYYLACRMDFKDNLKIGYENEIDFINNALLELDLSTYEINITRGVDINSLCAYEDNLFSRLYCSFNKGETQKVGMLNNSGTYFGTPMVKKWTSPMGSLGYLDKTKHIKEISIISKYDITIEIKTDLQTKSYSVKGSSVPQKIKTMIKGKLVEISFISNTSDAYICYPQITIGLGDK